MATTRRVGALWALPEVAEAMLAQFSADFKTGVTVLTENAVGL